MKIEAGKFYRTRDGRKVGPMRHDGSFDVPAFHAIDGDGKGWNETGQAIGYNQGTLEYLIAEWQDGPVRTVTRKEIVPGEYGRVAVDNPQERGVSLAFDNAPGHGGEWASLDADELRAVAATLTEIADALDGDTP